MAAIFELDDATRKAWECVQRAGSEAVTFKQDDIVRYEGDDATNYRVIYTVGRLVHIQRIRKDGGDDRRFVSVTAHADRLTVVA